MIVIAQGQAEKSNLNVNKGGGGRGLSEIAIYSSCKNQHFTESTF